MLKMIVTDLDGTLLRRDKTISGYTASVFGRCHNAGIKIVFATARPKRSVANDLDINIEKDACIYHNGAVIEIQGKLFKKTGIAQDDTRKLLKEAETLGDMKFAAVIDDMLYANYDPTAKWPGTEFTLLDLRNLPDTPADKILFNTVDRAYIERLEALLGENLYGTIAETEIYMVMNKQARKRSAVNVVAEQFGISLANTVAFGDDYNDVEMLRECGVGVAVANAIGEAKAAADYICDTNDNDGVAKWLEENVL
jgi:Cof subfamily protein (haloacid dehalogenase superfamily)